MEAENSTLFPLNIGDSLTNNAWGKGRWEGGNKERCKERWGEGRTAQDEGWRKGGSEGGREGGRAGGREGGSYKGAENSTLFSLNIGDSLTNNAWGKGRWEGGNKERCKERWGEGRTAQDEGWRKGGREGGRAGGR